jgi:predicted DNA-binding transcriptional regulator YafY
MNPRSRTRNKQAQRIIREFKILLETPSCASELAVVLNVSVTTTRRDIAAMRHGGIPLRRGTKARWRIEPSYKSWR